MLCSSNNVLSQLLVFFVGLIDVDVYLVVRIPIWGGMNECFQTMHTKY